MRNFYSGHASLESDERATFPQGSDLLRLCDNAAKAVAAAVEELAGTAAGGQNVKMGADGTPTKSIDRAAENAVLDTLQASGLGFKVLSEENRRGLDRREARLFPAPLNPLDGTFNAIAGIPFYSVSHLPEQGLFSFWLYLRSGPRRQLLCRSRAGRLSQQGGRLQVSPHADLSHFSISAYTLRPHTGRMTAIGDTVRAAFAP